MSAAVKGNEACLHALLTGGASVNAQDVQVRSSFLRCLQLPTLTLAHAGDAQKRRTALAFAAANGHAGCVEMLLHGDVEKNLTDVRHARKMQLGVRPSV
jgi:hypothetical protein